MNRPESRGVRGSSVTLVFLLVLAVAVSVPAVGQIASVSVTKTVGTTNNPIGTTNYLSVAGASIVYYFYNVANTGTVPLVVRDLLDDKLGHLLSSPSPLSPGASFLIVQSAFLTPGTTLNTAIVSASDNTTTTIISTGTSGATVDVGNAFLPASIPAVSGPGLAILVVAVAAIGLLRLRRLL